MPAVSLCLYGACARARASRAVRKAEPPLSVQFDELNYSTWPSWYNCCMHDS